MGKIKSSFILRRSLVRTLNILLLALVLIMPAGCAGWQQLLSLAGFDQGITPPETAESLAREGLNDFNHGRYFSALEIFNKLKERYPFSSYGLLAELKGADCQYYLEHYSEAIDLYREFENNHPTNEAVPYIMFQIGMCHYKQIDTMDRDTSGASEAIQAFSRLLRTYPAAPYVEEAKARIKAAREFLAGHEMYVADFYIRTESFAEADGRLAYLINKYPETAVVPRARELLAAIRSGHPPKRTWRSWLPEISLPDWKTFTSFGFRQGQEGGS